MNIYDTGMVQKKRLDKTLDWIAIVLGLIAIAALVLRFGIMGTLAAKPDIHVVLEQPNDYAIIEKGKSAERVVNGLGHTISNDMSVATAEVRDGRLRVTGLQAGSVAVTISSETGRVLGYVYQVMDSGLINAYTLKDGGEVHINALGKKVAIPINTEPQKAQKSIAWQSMDTDVATVENGSIVAKGKGVTIVLGTFTDCWGMERNVAILVFVGVTSNQDEPMSDSDFTALMTEAQSHLGKPYEFGMKGPDSFDCSGFVSWSLAWSGVRSITPSSAQGLYEACTPIAPANAQPGDLVFFTGTYDVDRPVTHVGIYIGNGYMIHAGNPVQYADINEKYWQDHFYGYGRLHK